MKIGLDVGGSHISVGAVKDDGILALKLEKELQISKSNNPRETLLDNIVVIIKEILNKLNISQIESIGIACPGTIRDGKIIRAENLNISEINISEDSSISRILEDKFNTKVSIKNDAKCAGLAEKKVGSIKKCKDAVFLTLGTGIGGAVFLENKILEPSKNSGFEIGHMVIDINGDMCTCGRRGCFETLASMKRLKDDIKARLNLPSETTGIEIKRILKQESTYHLVEDIINKYVYNLSIGVANLINLFEPEIISIGGSFVHYNDLLMEKLETELKKKNAIFNQDSLPKITIAELGNEAGIIGATL